MMDKISPNPSFPKRGIHKKFGRVIRIIFLSLILLLSSNDIFAKDVQKDNKAYSKGAKTMSRKEMISKELDIFAAKRKKNNNDASSKNEQFFFTLLQREHLNSRI